MNSFCVLVAIQMNYVIMCRGCFLHTVQYNDDRADEMQPCGHRRLPIMIVLKNATSNGVPLLIFIFVERPDRFF